MDVNLLVLTLFVVGGGLVGLMVVITQRSYKKDEKSEHWVLYPTARGSRLAIHTRPGEWSLVLDDAGAKKIQVIKEIRTVTGLGLAQAKALADAVPSTILSGVDHGSASAAYRAFTGAGARVRITEARGEPAAGPAGALGAAGSGACTVVVEDVGPQKIQVIKEIRTVTGLGLAEAKALVDAAPSTVLTGVDRTVATAARERLTAAGATVRVHPPAGFDGRPEADAATLDAATADAARGYDLVLDDAGAKKIHVIKEIRAITNLGLTEAKRLVDHTPSTILSGVDHAAATAAHGRLANVGAIARVAAT